MNRLTLAFGSDINVKLKDGRIVLDIPKSANRDLWKAQFTFWLENNVDTSIEKLTDTGYIRVENNNKISCKKERR